MILPIVGYGYVAAKLLVGPACFFSCFQIASQEHGKSGVGKGRRSKHMLFALANLILAGRPSVTD